jgi:rare lipoprotein A
MIRSLALAGAFCCALITAGHAETCTASQYGLGDGYHGRRTASGERFNTHALTAAHRTRAFGSHVAATNLANGRSVAVRITIRARSLHRPVERRGARDRHGRDGSGVGPMIPAARLPCAAAGRAVAAGDRRAGEGGR